jgi:hypothetical protein
MARVGGKVGLGTITKDHFFVHLGMRADHVRRTDWGLYPGSGWEGKSVNMARVGGMAELRNISLAIWEGGLWSVGGTGVK